MRKRKLKFRAKQLIEFKDGRVGITVEQNNPYAQWRVQLPDGSFAFWWESECEAVTA